SEVNKLDVNKREREIIEQALDHWREQQLISSDQQLSLKENLDDKGFEWGMLARYAFWIALASLIFSVVSLFSDDYLTTLIERFYETPNVVFCLSFSGLAILFYYLGFRNKTKHPDRTFSCESLTLARAFSTASAIAFLGQVLSRENRHFTLLFLLSIVVYGILSVRLRSQLLWLFMLVALGIWFAAEAAYHSNWG